MKIRILFVHILINCKFLKFVCSQSFTFFLNARDTLVPVTQLFLRTHAFPLTF